MQGHREGLPLYHRILKSEEMEIADIHLSSTPEILFGNGFIQKLPEVVNRYGKRLLLVTGGSSLEESGSLNKLQKAMHEQGLFFEIIRISGEPSPEMIDDAVKAAKELDVEVVVAVGGGSVIDAGKAISAMITIPDSVINYLEGVGNKKHPGSTLPFVALPTTAGTGSEATKNAVISRSGSNGFKKSLRHESFIPEVALIDPELALSCPKNVTVSTGMDTIVQLLEAFVSNKANAITDALAWSGLQHAFNSYERSCLRGDSDINARAGMAYASLLSGICLANAGLGIVHGFASVIGGYFKIPHGVVCGTLFAEAIKENIASLQEINPTAEPLKKYARVGYLAAGKKGEDVFEGWTLLLEKIEFWTEKFNLPKLGQFGINENNIPEIISETGQKNNPVSLSEAAMRRILLNRI